MDGIDGLNGSYGGIDYSGLYGSSGGLNDSSSLYDPSADPYGSLSPTSYDPSSDGLNATNPGSSSIFGSLGSSFGSILSGAAKLFGAVSTNQAQNALLQAQAAQYRPSSLSSLFAPSSAGGISTTTLLLIGGAVVLVMVASK